MSVDQSRPSSAADAAVTYELVCIFTPGRPSLAQVPCHKSGNCPMGKLPFPLQINRILDPSIASPHEACVHETQTQFVSEEALPSEL